MGTWYDKVVATMCTNDSSVVEIMKHEEKVLLEIKTCRKETNNI